MGRPNGHMFYIILCVPRALEFYYGFDWGHRGAKHNIQDDNLHDNAARQTADARL